MNMAIQSKDKEILRDLIPLNSLSMEHFREISSNLVIEEVGTGRYLFGEGDMDNRSIYLLSGEINFVDSRGGITGVVVAGTEPSRYPLANQQPRLVSARAARKSVVAWIDSTLLDVLLTFDQSASCKAVNISTQPEDDWMTRMFRTEAFVKVPPADIQRMLKTMDSVTVSAGDTIIRQGDEGDYFYIVRKGNCSVSRQASGEGWEVPLAELTVGDCFGEEALVSEARRNATVTMITDGILMRLAKQDFLELLKKPLVHYLDYDAAMAMIADGAVWLDVRLYDEYARYAFNDSINMPLFVLREKVIRLDSGKPYIICCDTGRRSASAAFLLSQRGFDVHVLEGGLNNGVPVGVFELADNIPGMRPEEEKTPAGSNPAMTLVTLDTAPTDTSTTAGATEMYTPPRERDTTPRENRERADSGSALQHLLSALQEEMHHYREKARQMEAACQQEREARDALQARLDAIQARLASGGTD